MISVVYRSSGRPRKVIEGHTFLVFAIYFYRVVFFCKKRREEKSQRVKLFSLFFAIFANFHLKIKLENTI